MAARGVRSFADRTAVTESDASETAGMMDQSHMGHPEVRIVTECVEFLDLI